ncbi:hypothetical protein Ciccas_005096 [Cichlidogyrus casuarinus]|uniref:Uncharacterized protein n=1 Tax=Cichlidogyrus casuarinus TaxID=1844966 RepID=A0ABD2Q9L7_9PLAT
MPKNFLLICLSVLVLGSVAQSQDRISHAFCHNDPRILFQMDASSLIANNKNTNKDEVIKNISPCCFPDGWKSQFMVNVHRQGQNSTSNHGAVNINHSRNEQQVKAIQILGREVFYTGKCNETKFQEEKKSICEKEEQQLLENISCLRPPYLGYPRCISQENNFKLSELIYVSKTVQQEVWFLDFLRPSDRGGIERHIYHIQHHTKLNVCRLNKYRVTIGQYTDPQKNCELLSAEDTEFIPKPDTFRIGFVHNMFEGLLLCF